MFFDTGSVSKRKSELFLTRESSSTWVYLRIYKLIVYLTPLFDAIIVLDRRYSRLLTANFAWFNWWLTVKIIHFWRLTVTFLTVWRLTVNPIETLLPELSGATVSRLDTKCKYVSSTQICISTERDDPDLLFNVTILKYRQGNIEVEIWKKKKAPPPPPLRIRAPLGANWRIYGNRHRLISTDRLISDGRLFHR